MTTTLRGTMLTPGVSRNGRLYTPDLIRKAHDRLAERIASRNAPATMLTHHAAGDDSTKIVGRLTGVCLNGDNLDYTAELASTVDSGTIESLVADGFLQNVSIRGWWLGPVLSRVVDGQAVETGDDLEIDGLDFTKTPGVAGAVVAIDSPGTVESVGRRVLITESVDVPEVFTETVTEAKTAKAPYGAVRYADPGYQSDKVKRYPIDTAAHAKAAWSYIGQADNQKPYTAAQLKRIRGRIKAALRQFGVTVSNTETTPAAAAAVVGEGGLRLSPVAECYMDGTGTAGFSISAYNGPLTVTVAAYNGVEPADLEGVALAAMQAACDAIHAMDPDDDGDIDAGADSDSLADSTVQGDQMEAAAAPTVKEALVADTEAVEAVTTESVDAVEVETVESTVEADAAEAAAPEAVEAVEGEAEVSPFDQLVAAVVAALPKSAPVEAAPAADLTETDDAAAEAAETVETVEAVAAPVDEAALREQIRAEVIAEARRAGVFGRKGLVEAAGAEPAKQLHEMTDDEFRAYQADKVNYFFAHGPAPLAD